MTFLAHVPLYSHRAILRSSVFWNAMKLISKQAMAIEWLTFTILMCGCDNSSDNDKCSHYEHEMDSSNIRADEDDDDSSTCRMEVED